MEKLIIDLKEKLTLRKEQEIKRVLKYKNEQDDKMILIATGRIFEIDNLLRLLDNMLNYHNLTKNTFQ